MAARLLIIHQGALGDFIVTFPVLKALRTSFSRIDGLCRSSFGYLARDLGILDHHYPLESRQVASLYADRIDPGVARILSGYSHFLMFSFSPVLEHSLRKIQSGRVFRIDPWPAATPNVHVTEFLTAQVLACGILSNIDDERFRRHLDAQRDPVGKKLCPGATIVLSPGAGSYAKRWPLERFMAVAARLSRRGFRPLILLGPAEKDLEAVLAREREPVAHVVKSLNLRELSGILNSADGYIGNDSGVSHLAAFLGKPVLVIFGPTDPLRWRPFGGNVSVVTPSGTCDSWPNAVQTDLREPVCLNQISPERVLVEMMRAFSTEAP